jgi:hypothetical protein
MQALVSGLHAMAKPPLSLSLPEESGQSPLEHQAPLKSILLGGFAALTPLFFSKHFIAYEVLFYCFDIY